MKRKLSTLLPALILVGCGGDGGGGAPADSQNLNGHGFICEGSFVHTDGRTLEFPCRGTSADCVPLEDAELINLDCAPTGQEKLLPGFDTATKVHESLCACIDPSVPLENQPGSCESVCNEVIAQGLLFDGETGWSCRGPGGTGVPRPHAEGTRPDAECTHGSIAYFNGGPADYSAQLFGSQTTSGSDAGFERSDSSSVDAWMEYTVGDRSDGCAGGCPFQISELTLIVHPFELEGVDVIFFSWPGLDINTSTLVSQGIMNGLVYDDGRFEIPGGSAQLNIEYTGSESASFATTLDRSLSGTIDFASGAIELDDIVYAQGKGQMRIHGLSGAALQAPPSPNVATAEMQECLIPEATEVVLDAAGSSDIQGGDLHFAWKVDGFDVGTGALVPVSLTLGPHEVSLRAADNTLGRARVKKTIEVVDTTPPAWGVIPKADFTTCDALVDRHPLTIPDVTDGCTGVADVEAFLVEQNGETLPAAVPLDLEGAALPDGEGLILWIATDAAGNQSSEYQEFEVGAAIVAESHLEIRDRVEVLQASGELGVVAALGNSQSSFGVESRLKEVQTIGPQFYQNYAVVTGLARSTGSITTQHGADLGIEEPFTPVSLVALPWLEDIQVPSGTSEFIVPPDQTMTLPAASRHRVHVYSRSTLVIPFDQVSIGELWIEPEARVVFTIPEAQLVVGDRWIHRGALEGIGHVEIVVTGQEVILERPVVGVSLIAPNARVRITTMADESRFGLLVGDVIEVQPDVTLWCDRQSVTP